MEDKELELEMDTDNDTIYGRDSSAEEHGWRSKQPLNQGNVDFCK